METLGQRESFFPALERWSKLREEFLHSQPFFLGSPSMALGPHTHCFLFLLNIFHFHLREGWIKSNQAAFKAIVHTVAFFCAVSVHSIF